MAWDDFAAMVALLVDEKGRGKTRFGLPGFALLFRQPCIQKWKYKRDIAAGHVQSHVSASFPAGLAA
jgi:hypothetical protein